MKNICYKCSQLIEKKDHYGLHEDCFTGWFGLDKAGEFTDIVRHASVSLSSDSVAPNSYWNSSFFQGKFKKYSARLSNSEYIIKVQESFAPELPHVEYVCNQIAEQLHLEIPPYYLIDFFDIPCFVSKNFILNLNQTYTLDHIYHFIATGDDYTCENLINIIESKTSSITNVEQFIEICLYDALIGNHDRHGRNLGLLKSRSSVRLAPAYDNTSALGLEQGKILQAQFNPRGKIATTNTLEPTMKDYVANFNKLGFNKNITSFFEKIEMENIKNLINTSFCSPLMKEALNKLISTRYQELKDAL